VIIKGLDEVEEFFDIGRVLLLFLPRLGKAVILADTMGNFVRMLQCGTSDSVVEEHWQYSNPISHSVNATETNSPIHLLVQRCDFLPHPAALVVQPSKVHLDPLVVLLERIQ
jgi:hypothetical protein